MWNEMFVRLGRFARKIQSGVQPPIRIATPSRETVGDPPTGSLNEGAISVVDQTAYNAFTGATSHVFMVDVDAVDDTTAPIG